MTISSSLNASVAGLSANASRLATISDNIANSSTYGYRRVETDFHSLVISESGGTYSAGGVRTTNKRLIDQGGSLISTGNATDLAVRGRGMLPVARSSDVAANGGDLQMMLATTGSFRTDSSGYLTTESGLVLLGWPAKPDGTIPSFPRDTSDGLEPIRINVNQFSGEPTTKLALGVNLPATSTDFGSSGDFQELSVEYYDNLGRSENIRFEFEPVIPTSGSSNSWTLRIHDSASDGAVVGEYNLTFEDDRSSGGTLQSVSTTSGGTYNPTTGTLILQVAGGPMEIEIGKLGDSSGLTQLSDRFAPVSIQKDGSAVGKWLSRLMRNVRILQICCAAMLMN